jgi:hypothetical protein
MSYLSVLGLAAYAIATTAPLREAASGPQVIALRITPGTYQLSRNIRHVVAYDLPSSMRKLAGTRADTTTILEDRSSTLSVANAGRYTQSDVIVRRYGGDHRKDNSVKQRTARFSGTLSDRGPLRSAGDALPDAGDGALDELPAGPLTAGQSWTFSRRIRIDADLGAGSLTYTDKLSRVEEQGGHRIAVVDVNAAGPVELAANLVARGFKSATMSLRGTALFDLTAGLPSEQHYTGHVQWNTSVMWVHVGVLFDDTYDATGWKRI